jgi:hypothetical protein
MARLMLLIVAVTAGLALAWCSPAAGQSAQSTPTQPLSAQPVTVDIDPYDPGAPVPQQFLGLSFEAAAISQIAQYTDHGDLVKLLRSLGPGVLRFGGITADENVAWTDAATPRPAWASSTIGPEQMHAIGVLARRSGWSVLLTVGLAHFEPIAAAREVAAAHRALGPYLAAIEIGNEPNAYGNHGFRELPWIAQGYVEEVGEYREAIAALTPGVPIAGPDVSGSGAFAEWGGEEALAQRPALLTGHHYPLGCAQTPAPSIETLLSAVTREREARSLATYLAVAHANGIPLRIGRDQRHVRLGAVGDRLHHAGDGSGSGGHQSPRQPGKLRRLYAALRAKCGGARGRRVARPAGVVRAAAEQIAGRRPAVAEHDLSRRLVWRKHTGRKRTCGKHTY